ncbi:hypothetical protein TNCV_1206091 [Trichonephila clavipes]|nr:hypothetical protein TNCV_1206091 [Trichonephila clavipes]
MYSNLKDTKYHENYPFMSFFKNHGSERSRIPYVLDCQGEKSLSCYNAGEETRRAGVAVQTAVDLCEKLVQPIGGRVLSVERMAGKIGVEKSAG